MAILEKVMQLKQQGATEPQIIDVLREEGVSPREIDEALSQSKIKSIIDTEQEEIPQPEEPFDNFQTPEMQSQIMPMQPSMVPMYQQQEYQQPEQQVFSQQQFEQQPMQQIPSARQPIVYEQTSEQYAPQGYYEEYAPQQASDIETINDIAEQIVEEKTIEIKKQIASFADFKDTLSLEVERINERLTRLENIFNELQVAILKKIGEYGESLQNIEKEMNLTQNSFSKIVNPLTDNIREMQKITGLGAAAKPAPKTKPDKKQKPGFEDYLR